MIGTGIFFFYLLPHWHWLLLSAFITFLYSAPKIPHPLFRSLRKIAIGKTQFLAIVWTFVTTILPIHISGQEWQNEFYYFIGHRFFLIYAICIIFDYRDREDDKLSGVRSLISYFDEKHINWLFCIVLSLFTLATLLFYSGGFSILQLIALLIPGVIVASVFDHAKRNFNDVFYYFVLDGLMAFSSLLMLIPGI